MERLGDRIAELSAHIDAATYRLLVLIARFERRFREAGGGLGFRSTAHWLSWRTGLGRVAARERVRVARALEELPVISATMARGELSYSKVRALTRVATPDNEAELVEFAARGTAAHVERLVRAWRRVDRLEAAAEEARRRSRRLSLWVDEDGSWVIRGRLGPEAGALLRQALRAAAGALYERRQERDDPAGTPAAGERRAEALGLVAEWALGSGGGSGTEGAPVSGARAERFQVVVHATPERLGGGPERAERPPPVHASPRPPGDSAEAGEAAEATEAIDAKEATETTDAAPATAPAPAAAAPASLLGPAGGALLEPGAVPLAAEAARRLACDASRVVVRRGAAGSVLDVGRKSRTVPAALRRALELRDGGCRFPGCGLRFCDAHHVVHWSEGGATSLDNLVLLCRRHHRAVHERGFGVEVLDGERGAVRFRRPDGRPLPEAPPPPAPPAADAPDAPNAAAALVRRNRERGLAIDARTATPDWNGEHLDLGLALDLLRRPPRAEPRPAAGELQPAPTRHPPEREPSGRHRDAGTGP